jgi:hypothetical protein
VGLLFVGVIGISGLLLLFLGYCSFEWAFGVPKFLPLLLCPLSGSCVSCVVRGASPTDLHSTIWPFILPPAGMAQRKKSEIMKHAVREAERLEPHYFFACTDA